MFGNSTDELDEILLKNTINCTKNYYISNILYAQSDLNEGQDAIILCANSSLNGSDVILKNDFITGVRSAYPVDDWLKLGYLTEDYLIQINRHWFDFDPPSRGQHYLMAFIYSVFMTVGVTGNSIVLYLFFRCRSLRTPANLLVCNLAFSDLAMILKAPVFIFNSLHFGPALGQIGCSVYGVVGGLTGVSSILTLSVIALDRYYAIAYPLSPSSRTTWSRAARWMLVLWIYSACLATAPLTGLASPYVPEGYLTSCSFDYLSSDQRTFIWVFFALGWVVPFLMIVTCYGGICRAVVGVGPSRVGQEREKRKTEVRLALVVIVVVAVWFMAWTPYAAVALLGISGYGSYITPTASMLPALFCKTASCIDPFIYAFTHPRFRREIFRLVCTKRYKAKRQITAQKTTVWRTESCNKKWKSRDEDEGIEIEEMIVTIDRNRPERKSNDSQTRSGLLNKSMSVDSSGSVSAIETLLRQEFNPPTWFVPPKNSSKSSFKSKSRVSQRTRSNSEISYE